MKDKIQEYLEHECKLQFWCRKHINKPKEVVEKINVNSISSVKQKLKK